MGKLPRFQMTFEPMTIEHLGLRLYSTLPPVISELVSNAFDAESPKVEVVLPTEEITSDSEVIVRDYGHSMTPEEMNEEYLPIGRCRRGDSGDEVLSKNGKVRVTGRKGLGKLSAFGVAAEMEVRVVHKKQAVCLLLNYESMKAWSKKNPGKPYEPNLVVERTGRTKDPDGVEVKLRKLRRKRQINSVVIRRGLAKRLRIVGQNFEVLVNGGSIKPGDRLQKKNCADGFVWDVSDISKGSKVVDNLEVKGWIGFLEASSQTERGVDIFAHKKAVELGSFFNLPSTHAQFARAYLVGEIHADFLMMMRTLSLPRETLSYGKPILANS